MKRFHHNIADFLGGTFAGWSEHNIIMVDLLKLEETIYNVCF